MIANYIYSGRAVEATPIMLHVFLKKYGSDNAKMWHKEEEDKKGYVVLFGDNQPHFFVSDIHWKKYSMPIIGYKI